MRNLPSPTSPVPAVRDGVSEKQELSMSCEEQNLLKKPDRVLEMHFALFNQ
jgi:hypothetical protein